MKTSSLVLVLAGLVALAACDRHDQVLPFVTAGDVVAAGDVAADGVATLDGVATTDAAGDVPAGADGVTDLPAEWGDVLPDPASDPATDPAPDPAPDPGPEAAAWEVAGDPGHAEGTCPQPVVAVAPGTEVVPLTVISLSGDASLPATGAIQSFHWTLEQPPQNKFNLAPDESSPDPTHQENVAGEYTYCLDVCDEQACSNDAKCQTAACRKVSVIPNTAIYVELTWDTPGDLAPFDQGANAGSDMDLHFTHPFATGPDIDGDGKPDGWFDIPYDCFWFNPHPDWESMNPKALDDPDMKRDDTDGWGPEIVSLDGPVSGRVYRIGVHYWDDHAWGFSYARVRVLIWGQLVLDKDLKDLNQKMFTCDLWEVATIEWPSGEVKAVNNSDGSSRITHDYQNPAFVQIGGGNCKTQ